MINPAAPKREILDIFLRMAVMAEFQNSNARTHLDRIKGYTYILARNLDETANQAEEIGIASVLHDIGKVGLPIDTTLNPDTYTAGEFEMIKKHTSIGSQLLNGSPSPLVRTAQVIALTHHERWDGSGYPDGLRGEEIPLVGRIMAVADVFDALTTFRAYKPPVNVFEATNMIREASGTLFDNLVVQVFSSHINEILNVRQNNL